MVIETIPIIFCNRYLTMLLRYERQLIVPYNHLIDNAGRQGVLLVYVPRFADSLSVRSSRHANSS
ncbi:hypothetical protein [Methanosarcina mazei]|uniref:hypothetical protein n=1 Tax=Methanosarcina mazei TaxID=2209 RepID=UPI001F1BECF2|nr:hypothetical protein [Methanosarcina mazei]